MKRSVNYFVLLGLFFTGILPSLSSESLPLKISDTFPAQGSLVTVEFMLNDCTPQVTFGTTRVPVVGTNRGKLGLIGIDLEAKPGPRKVTIEKGTCTNKSGFPTTRRLTVRKADYPVERLTIEDKSKVVLSDEDLKRHRRESKLIDNALNRITDVQHWTLDFHPPVKDEKFTSSENFGSRRIINGRPRSPHSGEDYPAEIGDPVYAINHGEVTLTGDFFFSGKSVFIDHGHGLISMYFHLSNITVGEGEFVKKGQSIGQAGSSGRVTGPHLHLGIKLRNNTIDPDDLYSKPITSLTNQ
jgi:hypothetical protein